MGKQEEALEKKDSHDSRRKVRAPRVSGLGEGGCSRALWRYCLQAPSAPVQGAACIAQAQPDLGGFADPAQKAQSAKHFSQSSLPGSSPVQGGGSALPS